MIAVDLVGYTGAKGGTDVYTRELYRSIARQGLNWNFYGLASREAKELDMTWFPGEVTFTELSGDNKFTWAVAETIVFNQYVKKIRPKLIHCPANFGPLKTSAKYLLTLHDALYWSHSELTPNSLTAPVVRFLQKKTTQSATKIITDSNASASDLIKYLNVPKDKIEVVYLGARSENIKFESDIGFENFFLAGGNRFRHKNWENLILAISLIEPRFRPKLVITGGMTPDPLESIVKKLNLSNNVFLLGQVTEQFFFKLKSKSKAIIIPSFVEGFSLPVVEAMKSGKPLILSEIPVHLELAKDVGYFFNPNSPESIASALLTFHPSSNDSLQKIRKGLVVSKNFSWEKCAQQTLCVMESLIDL